MPNYRPRPLTGRKLAAFKAEQANIARAISAATAFAISIYSSRDGWIKHTANTLAGARSIKTTMENEAARAGNHRRAMIYARTPDGADQFIPDNFNPGENR